MVGEKIRSIFLGQDSIAPEAELLLVFAARAQMQVADQSESQLVHGIHFCIFESPIAS